MLYMTQVSLSPICDCCGLPIKPRSGDICPRCNYPLSVAKEERFLESSIRDLQRVANHGGANLTISGLVARYQARLKYLRGLAGVPAPPAPAALSGMAGARAPIPPQALPPAKPLAGTPVPSQMQLSRIEEDKTPAAVVATEEPQRSPRRVFSFSLRSFVVDQAITLIGLLGAFLILMGALSSVVTTGNNPVLSFLIVFGVHAFFGIAGVIAYQFANFKLIARIYSGIYVLLVPLVGFTGYNVLLGTQVQLSAPALIAIAAAYAAIVYTLLAIYERFPIYVYLVAMALVVADLAVAAALQLNFWWWPSMLLLLAIPALASIARSPSTRRER